MFRLSLAPPHSHLPLERMMPLAMLRCLVAPTLQTRRRGDILCVSTHLRSRTLAHGGKAHGFLKEARAQREAQARERGQGGDDLDDTEPESRQRTTGKVDVGEGDESAEESVDGYYSLVQKQKRERKESEKLAYEVAKATIRCVVQPCFAVHPVIASLLLERAHTGRLMKMTQKAHARSRVRF